METSSSQTLTSRPSPIRRLINCTCGLAQIVGAGLETQAELRNLLFARAQHHFRSTIDVLGVARHEGFEQGEFEIKFLGFVGDRAEIFRKAGTAEGEARGKICGRNVQFGVGGKNLGDRVRVDA
jgi:hypothetical protein